LRRGVWQATVPVQVVSCLPALLLLMSTAWQVLPWQ
jgi:hypothetical protein